MVTIFLTDEATDALTEGFIENGFPEGTDADWASDILIELTDVSMTVRCQKNGDEESYQKADRFFPPTLSLRDSAELQTDEEALEEIHEQAEDFLNGEIEVSGIPTDEEHSWLRSMVLIRRLVIPYVQKHISDGSYREQEAHSGIHIYCSEDGVETQPVSGEERPELLHARFAEDGRLVEEPGRYYEDELFSEEKLKSAIRELENRPRYLNVESVGDALDWPPQFLEQFQCGRLLMDGRLRKNELGPKVVPVSFRRKDFLWQHPQKPSVERIYVTVDTLLKLPEADIPLKRIPPELLPETAVEIIDSAFICLIEIDGPNLKNTKLSLYNRFGIPMLSPVRAEAAGVCEGVEHFLEDGHFASDGEGYLGDVAFSLLFGYRKLLGVLIAADWYGRHGRTENDQSGILIETDGEEITVRRVTGTQRPELICSAPEGERVSFRPYQGDDESDEPEAAETVSVQEILDLSRDPAEILSEKLRHAEEDGGLEKSAARGDPQAMKLLAMQLLRGEPTTEERKQALAWYEKAAALLPKDDDLEFEIFMLKMDIDNE
ncbi:MAG: hypothetical protein K6C12_08320 [Oscillospiraceae bacterium]|nr:hypothetical protein [Oscillospiraceae bacterium]